MRPSRDYNGISTLRRYFAQLHLLRARFPPETIGQLPIDFVWYVHIYRETSLLYLGTNYGDLVREVFSFQGVGIEEFHCIQRCPHFRGLE